MGRIGKADFEADILGALRRAYGAFVSGDLEAYAAGVRAARSMYETKELVDDGLHGELLLVDALRLLGDASALLAAYRRAADLLDGCSRVLPRGTPLFPACYDPFVACFREPGTADRVVDDLEACAKLHRRLVGGGAASFAPLLCRAQLAFYRGEVDAAREMTDRVQAALPRELADFASLALVDLQLGIAKQESDLVVWKSGLARVTEVCELASTIDKCICQMAALVRMMNMFSVGIVEPVDHRMETGDFGVYPLGNGYGVVDGGLAYSVIPMAYLARVEYLSYRGNPAQALLVADEAQKLCGIGGMIIYDAFLDFFRAGCWLQLSREQDARACIDRAVDCIAPDYLWQIAAEFEPAFGEILHESVLRYGDTALRTVCELGGGYWDRLRLVKDAEADDSLVGLLTSRELEVSRFAAQGLPNRQIAEQLVVSERTVKYHLLNAYAKLKVNRRVNIRAALDKQGPADTAWWMKN